MGTEAGRSLLLVVLLAGCTPSSDSMVKTSPQSSSTVALGDVLASNPKFAVRNCNTLNACDFSNGRPAAMNTILEIVGGGAGCWDYDNDGNCDLVFARGGSIDPVKQQVTGINVNLMRSAQAWEYTDLTQAAHIDSSRIHSHGVSVTDFDHDGFEDLLIYGYNGIELFHNLGDGSFQLVTQTSGMRHSAWTTTACWLDFNRDQNLDLFLGSYVDWNFQTHSVCQSKSGSPDVCSPNVFPGQNNVVYLSQGDGTFAASPDALPSTQPAKSLGSLAANFFTGEGIGLYVANDLIANFLFSKVGDQYQELAFSRGAAIDDAGVANGSMGLALLDFNLDQQADIFVTNFEHEKMGLYVNQGSNGFHYSSRQAGLNRSDLQLVGFGVVAADFDSDGDEDVLFTSGHVHYQPDHGTMEQLPAYLVNEAGRKFNKLVPKCDYFTQPSVGRGLATADLDNDGDLDLVATSLFGPPKIVENSTPPQQWLTLRLIGTRSSRHPIGSTVQLTCGGQKQMRQLYGGGSYLSHSQSLLHFAWRTTKAPSTKTQLTIHWPSGQASTHEIESCQQTVVVEP